MLVNYNAWPEGINHPLFLGDVVKIPPELAGPVRHDLTRRRRATAAVTVARRHDDQTTTPAGVGCTHTVVEGDNPTRVANQYGITVDELAAANAGNPAYQNFLIGSQLSIPANGSC